MPSMNEIRASNLAALQSKLSLITVFAGATSGIGLGALKALLLNTTAPRVYIIGRSRDKFAATLSELQSLNPAATLRFVRAQVSLLADVSRVCAEIASQESRIDVLWLSQGGLDMSQHSLTPEGLFAPLAITYYSRTLFMHKLLPLLNRSSRDGGGGGGGGRIVSVLATGQEGPINMSDPGIQHASNYESFWAAEKQGVTMMSLAMAELAAQNPHVSFMHTAPGFVGTAVHDKWSETMTGIWAPIGLLMKFILIPLTHLFAIKPDVAGEVGFYELSSERFASKNGQNFWRLLENGEEAGEQGQAVLTRYRDDGTQAKLWDHTLGEFSRILVGL